MDTTQPLDDHRRTNAQLPSGVVTFVFTDVEGSTRLLHELGDGYAAALHEHRRIVREAFGAHGGVEVDTQGDAFFFAFARASDAVAAAAAGQRGLAGGPIRVRMGLHSGEPIVTAEGYVGLDVHKGARIAAVGHGRQVLLSEATHALVDVRARDLGPHRLKDLTAPERIYQLEIEGVCSEFPPLKTLDSGSTNLPSPRTSFVGRREELAEIDRRLEDPTCRLLTLVGPGGIGKTRLALEAAARRLDHYPHGVHFVPLASVAGPEFLAPAVADALQFAVDAAHSGLSAQDQLVDYLSERSTLLVLDNFEHLVEGAGLVTSVLERAPNVEILTTSRERLNVQSEWVLDVEGLDVSGNGNGAHADGAVRLFVERARQIDPGFELPGAGRARRGSPARARQTGPAEAPSGQRPRRPLPRQGRKRTTSLDEDPAGDRENNASHTAPVSASSAGSASARSPGSTNTGDCGSATNAAPTSTKHSSRSPAACSARGRSSGQSEMPLVLSSPWGRRGGAWSSAVSWPRSCLARQQVAPSRGTDSSRAM